MGQVYTADDCRELGGVIAYIETIRDEKAPVLQRPAPGSSISTSRSLAPSTSIQLSGTDTVYAWPNMLVDPASSAQHLLHQ